MKNRFQFLLLLSVLMSFLGFGQEQTKLLKGTAKSLNNDVSDVLIINLNSKKSTITDSSGLFAIDVKLGDSLRFTSVQYVTKEIVVTEKVFYQTSLVVNLIEDIIDLDEVTVTPYNFTGKIDSDLKRLHLPPKVTSSTLKLPNADKEKMTQSQRLLIEADRGKYVYWGLGFTINLHKTINRLSGRTRAFEERVARDDIMALEKEIIARFSKKSMSRSFDIPEADIDGFLTYCMSQPDFLELSGAGNTEETWKYLKGRSNEFKKN